MKDLRSLPFRFALPLIAGVAVVTAAPQSWLVAPAAAQTQTRRGGVEAILSPTLPAGAQEIAAAAAAAKVGETITIRGRISDTPDAFAANESVFTLTDESAAQPPASDQPAGSETPAAARCTVQIVNSSGKPLAGGLTGKHGLKPGAEVFVTGTVKSAGAGSPLVLAASSMHVPRSSLPVGFFTTAAPAHAKDLSEIRKAGGLKVGDEVVIRGRVGGSKDPFVPGRAVLTLMGRGLKACNENPDDACAFPWDYCCETKQDILANSATVQVVDQKGAVLRTDLKGRHDIKELTELVVIGKVALADGKALVVNASKINVVLP